MSQHSDSDWLPTLLQRTGATALCRTETVQRLWKGHGQILRVSLSGGTVASVIVKEIAPIAAGQDLGLQRKQHSYKVERAWYAHYSHLNGPDCRLPRCLAQGSTASGDWLILEGLDAAGYPQRRRQPDTAETAAVLKWLACFHARWLGTRAPALWTEGSYWHLATRPAEWQALPDSPLKTHAHEFDQCLKQARFQTLIHGDAKPANFCFGASGVAAVDFQYVGHGPGVKDLVYFLSAIVPEEQAAQRLPTLRQHYFDQLSAALSSRPDTDADAAAIVAEWQALFAIAWLDYYRFERGWLGSGPAAYPYSEACLQRFVTDYGAC
ncbi:MAG: phosphotransferase [Candidatus Sericytochromatia bacterium]|nr:phosphotransferase [Candidatus Sericytochromatia bacterium]